MGKYFKRTALYLAVSIVIFILLSVLISANILNAYYERVLIMMCINIILALSANLIINISGQLTLGHSAFMAIGAYASAMLTIKAHMPFLVVLLFGALLSALFGFLIGLPTLRLKGDYLAITTLGFCQIVVVILQNIKWLGGAQGLPGIPPKTNLAWVFFGMVATVLLLSNLVHSKHGRAIISVREDEIAAQAMGVNTTRYKIMAFTIGAFFAGFAGALYAHFMMYIEPTTFNFMESINFVIYVVLGGTGGFVGCIAATSILSILLEALRSLGSLDMVIYPMLLIIIMLLRVKGLNFTALIKGRFMSIFRKSKLQGGK